MPLLSCPDKNRIFILLFISVGLTSILTLVSESVGNNLFSKEKKRPYKDKNGSSEIKDSMFFSSVFISFATFFYSCYLLFLYLKGPVDLNNCPTVSVKPYEDTMLTTRSCVPTNPILTYDSYEKVCRYTYTGGMFPFLLFVSAGIFLVIFGSQIMKEHDPEETSIWLQNVAISSICVGAVSILISSVDLIFC